MAPADGKFPDVYIQAVSGGTGPIAIDKGIREISHVYPELKNPRFLLVQTDGCDPMVQAWEKAEADGFPEGFEKNTPLSIIRKQRYLPWPPVILPVIPS